MNALVISVTTILLILTLTLPSLAASCASYLAGANAERAKAGAYGGGGNMGGTHMAAAAAYMDAYRKCLAGAAGGGGAFRSIPGMSGAGKVSSVGEIAGVAGTIFGLLKAFSGSSDAPEREPTPEELEQAAQRAREIEEQRQRAAAAARRAAEEHERQEIALAQQELEARAERAAEMQRRQVERDLAPYANDILDSYLNDRGMVYKSDEPSLDELLNHDWKNRDGLFDDYIPDDWRVSFKKLHDSLRDGAVDYLKDSLREGVESFRDDFFNMVTGGQDRRESAFDKVFGGAVDEVKSDATIYINEALRTPNQRLRDVTWGGDSIVQTGVGKIIDRMYDEMKSQLASRMRGLLGRATGAPDIADLDPAEAQFNEYIRSVNPVEAWRATGGGRNPLGLWDYWNNSAPKGLDLLGLW